MQRKYEQMSITRKIKTYSRFTRSYKTCLNFDNLSEGK